MEKIVSLCKRRGFVFPGSEIYGGLANTWDYGPLGSQMRQNLKRLWWQEIVEKRANMVGLDGAILMNPRVWQASGHVDTFNDPLVEDVVTHKRYRADHLIEEATGSTAEGLTMEQMQKLIEKEGITSPDGNALTPPRSFNLMFQTQIGSTSQDAEAVYLRPETAQAMFVQFKNVLTTSRQRLPFGIGQIGKAFRNEITPGNFVFRTLEFEQMEIEYFVEETQWEEAFQEWLTWMKQFAGRIGVNTASLHELDVPAEELAHYSKKTVDLEFDFPFGKKELWGLAYRTDFDLRNHQENSGEKLVYTDPHNPKRKFIPHVVEPTMGVDRTLLAILVSAYDEEQVGDSTDDMRTVMRFTPEIAPFQVAVLPLSKKPELANVANPLFEELSQVWRAEYDETQSIGKRYRRQDEIGTPMCITVDFDSIEDKAVTVRDRDSMQQERVPIATIKQYLEEKL